MSESKPSDTAPFLSKISKSRLKTWVKCPRKFYYKYVLEIETPETESMRRGTDIHDILEAYYHNIVEHAEDNEDIPNTLFSLLDKTEVDNWQQYVDPYLAHFLAFERRRWNAANGDMDDWLPIAIEEEIWRDVFEDTPTLMGLADVLLPAASFPDSEVPHNEGYVLIDFKTGEPKSDKYRSHENAGVFLDLAYYAILFDTKYDIVAVGGYYPLDDTLVTSGLKDERQKFIKRVAHEVADADADNLDDFPINETPLCAWGAGEDERCAFYDQCDSTWAVPIDNEEETVQLIRDGYSDEEIAEELGTTADAVGYWVRKKRWHRYR